MKNIVQSSPFFSYVRVFYNNIKNKYFIINKKNLHILEKGRITGDKRTRTDDIDPCITIGNKKIRLYNLLMGTKTSTGEQCDHLNHQTSDLREENLRNCTDIQNKANTPKGIGQVIPMDGGKFGIKFPNSLAINTSKFVFDTKQEAENKRRQLQIDIFGDFSYERSQEIARKIETYEFVEDKYVDRWANTGTLGKILNLPPDNPLNARLRDLMALIKSERIFPDEEWRMQHDLMYDYYMQKEHREATSN